MRLVAVACAGLLAALLSGCNFAEGEGDRSLIGEPPDGTRWVGSEGIVVAVPDWWTTGDTRCGAPIEDTVYFDTGATYDCVDADKAAVDEVSALALLDAGSGYGEKLVAAMEPSGEINGVPVVERPGCEYWFEGVCRRIFAVLSLGVVFAVTINEDSDGRYETIRDSLRRLPAEVIAVPLKTADGLTPGFGAEPKTADALIRAIERAGLEVATEVAEVGESDSGSYASLPEGSLLEIEPGPGSPIATGGSVTVTRSGASMDPAQ